MEKLGDRLRKFRETLDLGQKEFAEKLGFSAPTIISRFENNNSVPSVETLQKIAEAFNIDLHWLITGRNAPSNESMRSNYIRSLSLLHTQLFYGINHQLKTIEEFEKRVADLKQKQSEGIALTEAEDIDLKFYSGHIPFQKSILEQFLRDQAWAAQAMNEILGGQNPSELK